MKENRWLVLATGNTGKVREYRRLLAGTGFGIVTPAELGLDVRPEETGATFADNAVIKAEALAEATGMPSLADDSGLEVDALGGQPGVESARYGGAGLDDIGRFLLVLRRLAGVPEERRTARFRCAIALAAPRRETVVVEGTVEGRIALEARGEGGFGYDPVFLPEGRRRTMAELSPGEKDALSHRARAAVRIRPELERLPENI
jgi:XTP/dITP diphosphohydrolase